LKYNSLNISLGYFPSSRSDVASTSISQSSSTTLTNLIFIVFGIKTVWSRLESESRFKSESDFCNSSSNTKLSQYFSLYSLISFIVLDGISNITVLELIKLSLLKSSIVSLHAVFDILHTKSFFLAIIVQKSR
jgi:hypothetical protein